MDNLKKKLREVYENVYPGWWELLDKYLPQIWAIDPDCDIFVKEKYGLLRIRPYNIKDGLSWRDFHSIYAEAENASEKVCEICGEPGHLRTNQDWWQTLCDRCAAMDQDERIKVGLIVSARLLEEMEQES